MQTGEALIADVDGTDLGDGHAAFWWLGQHSFILKMGATIIYVDPFLAPNPDRCVPPMFTPPQAAHATLICGTHDHGDHIDRTAWPDLARSTRAVFVVPDAVRRSVIDDLGIDTQRVLGLDDGASVEVASVRISAVAAAHEFLERDDEGRYRFLGLVFEANGVRIYHAGDTCRYEGLETRLLKHAPIDVAMLPINGRDAVRFAVNCQGNMTYQEAVDLAGAVEPGMTVPTHYDMFEFNSEDPQLFVDYMRVKYPHLKAHVCKYGERVLVG